MIQHVSNVFLMLKSMRTVDYVNVKRLNIMMMGLIHVKIAQKAVLSAQMEIRVSYVVMATSSMGSSVGHVTKNVNYVQLPMTALVESVLMAIPYVLIQSAVSQNVQQVSLLLKKFAKSILREALMRVSSGMIRI
jgi:hypothetical protein